MDYSFASFTILDRIFLLAGVVGTIGVLFRLVLLFAGGDLDGDDAGPPDGDGFRALSVHGLSSFFMMFGLVGLALGRQSRAGAGWSLLGGLLAGLAAVWIIARLCRFALRLQSSGTLPMEAATGCSGTVYLTIPAGGTGRVNVRIGLYLINVNITDITDESGYIDSIGKKAAAEAINQAKVDVAEQEKLGSIGESEATREREIKVAENVAEAQKGKKRAEADQRVYVKHQEATAVGGENEALADIARTSAELAVQQAEAGRRGEVARREAEVEIQKAQYRAETERLNALEVARQEVDKRKVEIAAEAEAEKTRREARGVADAILLKYQAEAEGIRKVLESKAAGFLAGMIKSLPPLHDVAGLAGIELPRYLGRVAGEEDAPPL